jgi:hypothetical protein
MRYPGEAHVFRTGHRGLDDQRTLAPSRKPTTTATPAIKITSAAIAPFSRWIRVTLTLCFLFAIDELHRVFGYGAPQTLPWHVLVVTGVEVVRE